MAHEVEIGTIFVYKIMYDDTTVSFYQVVKVTEKTVTIREIEAKAASPEVCKSDTCVPVMNAFARHSEPLRKTVQPEGYLRFDHGYAYPWDGKPQYRSWGR